MTFPIFEVPWLGSGPVLTAFFFVFSLSAYFVLGGGLFMVLLEHKAHREGNQALLSFLQDWSRFFLLMSVILTLGLALALMLLLAVLQPHTAVALLRSFFWVWGVVWLLTVLEVAAALLYYSGWGVVSPGTHLAFGWIFVGASWLSMFSLNGVQAVMQNPAKWIGVRHFVNCFLTQTFNPSLLMQVGLALGVAGLFSLMAGTSQDPLKLRVALVRRASAFVIAGFFLLPLGLAWYAVTLPAAARADLVSPAEYGGVLFYGSLALSTVIFLFAATGPMSQPSGSPRSLALLLFALGIVVTFAAGDIREAGRMPYVIRGKLYVNGIPASRADRMNRSGFLRAARYARVKSAVKSPVKAGEDLFQLQCASCHTLEGFRGIRRMVKGWGVDVLDEQLASLERMRGSMPPFVGTPRERLALAKWLRSMALARSPDEGR